MKSFFSATYYFWQTFRMLFIIAGFISIAGIVGTYNMRTEELLANAVVVGYLLIMIYNTYLDLTSGKQSRILKYISGSISLLLGLILLILVFTVNVVSVPAALIFCCWIALLGLFDLLLIKKKQVTL